MMGRPAKYTSKAEKQKAYRARKRNAEMVKSNTDDELSITDLCALLDEKFGHLPKDDGRPCPNLKAWNYEDALRAWDEFCERHRAKLRKKVK